MTKSHSLDGAPVEWVISDTPIAYGAAVAFMESRVAAIAAGDARELVWLLEHPSLYTAGTSANPSDLLTPDRFPVHTTGRGGQYTYHGPGQRIAYVMLNVGERGRDVRHFVSELESWLIDTVGVFGLRGERAAKRIGIWIHRPQTKSSAAREDKIAALGIRLRKWVSYHGISINVAPNLEHFKGIVPCGITDHGATSLADLGIATNIDDVDVALRSAFEQRFGATKLVGQQDFADLPGGQKPPGDSA